MNELPHGLSPALLPDLSLTTFLIPVHVDSDERLVNIRSKMAYLQGTLRTNVILIEHGHQSIASDFCETVSNAHFSIHYIFDEAPLSNQETDGIDIIFHRTKLYNQLFLLATTPVVCLADADSFVAGADYLEAQTKVLDGEADAVSPYNIGTTKHEINFWGKEIFSETKNLDFLSENFSFTRGLDCAAGSELFLKRKTWLRIGLENENIINHATEKEERLVRLTKFGFDYQWLKGKESYLYHLFHPPSPLPQTHLERNNKILNHLGTLDEENYKDYFKNQDYLEGYGLNI